MKHIIHLVLLITIFFFSESASAAQEGVLITWQQNVKSEHVDFSPIPPVPGKNMRAYRMGGALGMLLPFVGIIYAHHRFQQVSYDYEKLYYGSIAAADLILAGADDRIITPAGRQAFCTAYKALRRALGSSKKEHVDGYEKQCDTLLLATGLTCATHNRLRQELIYAYNFWDGMKSGSCISGMMVAGIVAASLIEAASVPEDVTP